jgi:integrase
MSESTSLAIVTEGDPWARCLVAYLRQLYEISGSTETLRIYKSYLARFFSQGKPVEAYTKEDVLAFMYSDCQSTRNRGAPMPATVNLRLTVVASFLKFASIYTIPGPDGKPTTLFKGASPTLGIRRAKPAKTYRAMNTDELEKFFSVIDDSTIQGKRDRAIFTLYLYSARRREEIARLTFGDIERCTLTDEDGTRREGHRYRFRNKGHSREDDYAELAAPAKAAIDDYLIASGRLPGMKPEDPLFVSLSPRHGGGPANQGKAIRGASINARMKHYAKLAGIDEKRLSVHSWRHSSVQQRHAMGENVESIRKLLRHKSLQSTATYLYDLSGTSDPMAAKLEARFSFLRKQ